MYLSDHFIGATTEICDFNNPVPAPYLRKTFDLAFTPAQATVAVTGIGFYELYVNGVKTAKGETCPYISNPDDLCYYDVYNVADNLHPGKNCIALILGNGFRNAFGGFIWDFEKAASRGPVACALCLEASGEGQTLTLETDETFKTHPSPILFDDIRMGYHYDSRLEIEGWNLPEFDDGDWKNAIRIPSPRGEKKVCTADPIRVAEQIPPISVTHYDEMAFVYSDSTPTAEPIAETLRKDVYVYDFGINSAGVTELTIDGLPGQRIEIRHGEALTGGHPNLRSTMFLRKGGIKETYFEYSQKDVFICRGGRETFVPRFKYDGFRYAFVEGLRPEQATPEALTFRIMHSALTPRADFVCSDDTLNELQRMVRRSNLSNFYYFPTDCPHREKNGWTGDASISADHMLLNLRASDSLREWLCNIRKAQRADGALPGIVPTGGWGFDWGSGPAWDMVAVSLPYRIFKYEGDKTIITENAEMIDRYLHYAKTRLDERGLAAYGLGDWCDPGETKVPKKPYQSPLEVTDSIQLLEMATKAAELFRIAELHDKAAYAETFAKEMRSAIRTHFVDETLTVKGDCQCSQVFALRIGVFEESEIPTARKRLLEIIHRDGDISFCGMIGMRHLFHELSEAGESDLAYKLIVNKECRSCYGYWVGSGFTTMQETFREKDAAHTASQNHHFFGDISAWMIRRLAGLDPTYYGHNDPNEFYSIRPQFVSALTFARATYEGHTGQACVDWHRDHTDASAITLEVRIPPNCRAEICLPNGWAFRQENGCGSTDCIRMAPSSHAVVRRLTVSPAKQA